MCLSFWLHRMHPQYALLIADNRDEFLHRPTKEAHYWDCNPQLLAGKDLIAGGTWFGVTTTGRIALLTNIRETSRNQAAPSRGILVTDFLSGSQTTEEYYHQLQETNGRYNGFNLVFGDICSGRLGYVTNGKSGSVQLLDKGLYGLSNATLNVPWPKVVRGKERFMELVREFGDAEIPAERIISDVLGDTQHCPDDELQETVCQATVKPGFDSVVLAAPV
mmetsp:Transcript_1837/g.6551  ORF Transcript_1837/g.6551 Transcript_1837/m.6551 type:complete len:220 (+) Transcript_1837:57-716(+)